MEGHKKRRTHEEIFSEGQLCVGCPHLKKSLKRHVYDDKVTTSLVSRCTALTCIMEDTENASHN